MTRNPLAQLSRYDDGFGASVPITGRWCTSCGYPLHPVLVAPVHPCCTSRGTR